MRILVITSSYPRFPGDWVAPFVDSITRSVARLGHSVHVLVPEHRQWDRPAWDREIHFHSFRYSPVRSWTPWGFSESLASGPGIRKLLYPLAPVVGVSAIRAARRVLAEGGFDVVHAHWVVPNGPIARAVAGRVPVVVSLHGSDVAVSERSRVLARATRWALAGAAAVTAPSEDLLERAHILGADCRLEHLAYGADVEEFSVDPNVRAEARARLGVARGDVLVLGVGRLIPVKGFDVLVDAYAAASTMDSRLRLALIGDGSERTALMDRVRSLGISARVRFVGAAEHSEVPAYLAAADIVAVPSVRRNGYVDGLPNVALEAMAAGKPLIASRVGGLPALVRHGETGLLVDEQDTRALASALRELADEPELRAHLAHAGQNEIRNRWSWRAVGERLVGVYESVTGSRGC